MALFLRPKTQQIAFLISEDQHFYQAYDSDHQKKSDYHYQIFCPLSHMRI